MNTINITAGEDYNFLLRYKDSCKNIIDLTGATARMMVRKNHYITPIITKVAIITEAAGEILFDFDPSDTNTLITSGTELKFIYDVELTEVGGIITILSAGSFIVTQAVTRG